MIETLRRGLAWLDRYLGGLAGDVAENVLERNPRRVKITLQNATVEFTGVVAVQIDDLKGKADNLTTVGVSGG